MRVLPATDLSAKPFWAILCSFAAKAISKFIPLPRLRLVRDAAVWDYQ